MTAYIDESVPVRLVRSLAAVGCRALRFPNSWKGLKNGELLRRLEDQSASCLITCDKNMRHQQTISGTGIALIVLPRQRFGDLAPIAARIAEALKEACPGEILLVSHDGAVSRG